MRQSRGLLRITVIFLSCLPISSSIAKDTTKGKKMCSPLWALFMQCAEMDQDGTQNIIDVKTVDSD